MSINSGDRLILTRDARNRLNATKISSAKNSGDRLILARDARNRPVAVKIAPAKNDADRLILVRDARDRVNAVKFETIEPGPWSIGEFSTDITGCDYLNTNNYNCSTAYISRLDSGKTSGGISGMVFGLAPNTDYVITMVLSTDEADNAPDQQLYFYLTDGDGNYIFSEHIYQSERSGQPPNTPFTRTVTHTVKSKSLFNPTTAKYEYGFDFTTQNYDTSTPTGGVNDHCLLLELSGTPA